jgi:hypothetical protein
LIGPGGLLLVVSHLFVIAVLVYGWGWKKKITKLGFGEIFLQGHILSSLGDALITSNIKCGLLPRAHA